MSTRPIPAPVAPPVVQPGWEERIRSFRVIPRLETYPRVVAYVQTPGGKLSVLAIFGLLLALMDTNWAEILGVLTLTTYLPQLRRWLVLGGTFLALSTTPFFGGVGILKVAAEQEHFQITHLRLMIVVILPFLLLSVVLLHVASRWRRSLLARRPIFLLLVCYFALLATSCYLPVHGQTRFLLCCWLAVFGAYIWYLAYSITDSVKTSRASLTQLAAFHPFWPASSYPIGKTLNYWKTIEAKDPEQLAIAQIKGLKLLTWNGMLWLFVNVFKALVQGQLKIPTFELILAAQSMGRHFPVWVCWASLLASFITTIIGTCLFGHLAVAIFRMAGYNALRNTRSPLTSKTIAEFWNRYYYYFKELLVDFFFYPTFVRYFKKNLKVRIAAATFMAAGVGNVLFHFIRDSHFALALGLPRGIFGFGCYAFYCLILSGGIIFSQLRSRKVVPGCGWFRRDFVPMLTVSGFFLLLHIFDSTAPEQFLVRVHFLQHLFFWS